ncbi:MAG TPA: hypothetical protein VE978_04735 [Chitinophagales bacterium]|nr:hypothetical protein [Chitinophagales bacterium]
MIKDIILEKVTDVAVAVIPEPNELGEPDWSVYLLNLKADAIDGVLISSKGYGNIDGRDVKTSTLRQFWEKVAGKNFVKVELIEKKLFGITNEFWVSFWHHGILYDKRYVFVTESIVENNFTTVPLINKRGVMIK